MVVAEGLRVILDAEDDLAVVDVAHDDGQTVASASQHRPAVLAVDAQLPDRDLGQTLAAVQAASPATKLLVLSGPAEPGTAAAVLPVGADGCARKDGSVGRWHPSSAGWPPASTGSWRSDPGRA